MVFSWAACAAATVYRDHFFCLYQQNQSSESKVKFMQTSNHCKRVLEAAKLACVYITKESITSQKLGSCFFLRLLINVLNNGKSAIPSLFNLPEVLSSASGKKKYLLKFFLRTLTVMTQLPLYLCYLFYFNRAMACSKMTIKAQEATLLAVSLAFVGRFEHVVLLSFIFIVWQFVQGFQ